MFAAGMSAAGIAARDRRVQSDIRMGEQLARQLLAEIVQQRYADPAPNTIAPTPGISSTNRSNWTHIDDYTGFTEFPPRERAGTAIAGATGWAWKATIAFEPFSSFAGATAGSGGMVAGVPTPVSGTVSGVLDLAASSATDTGLKSIVVTVTAPNSKTTTLAALRSAAGAVDRVSTGFHVFAYVNLLVGSDKRSVTTGAPLLNTPAAP
jgi:hypothetical protein